jgi:hypothetical protein
VANPNVYSYRVRSFNGTVPSAYSNVAANVSGAAATVPVAPTGLTVSLSAGTATLNWSHPGGANLTDFTLQRATNATFTVGVSSFSAPAGTTTALDAVPGVGPYYYRIRANGSAGSSAWTNAPPFPVGATALPLVFQSLTTTSTLPGTTGSPITWTAIATGGVAPLQYEFWINDPVLGWSTAGWSTSNTVTFTPSGSGTYSIQAWVRNNGSAAAYDVVSNVVVFTVTGAAPLTVTGVGASPTLPVAVGIPVTWSVTTTGGTAPLQYEFWINTPGVGWVTQGWGASSSISWTPTVAGAYTIQVWVRNAGSVAAYDAVSNVIPFTITP